MRYISKIIIENFQSHSHSVFTLKQGLNVIVGPSDSGKSAVIRALKWVLYNEPAGDFFIREGEKDCSVTVEFNDGTILKRYRSKSRNGYLLLNSDNEEMRFEGIGSGVPEEIVDATGISKIILDQDSSSAINLGEQLEGPFLLSEKPSTRANAIGRLVGVNLLDDALREVLKDIRNINLRKKETEEALISLDEEIKSYNYLDDLKNKSLISSDLIKKAENLLEVKARLELLSKSLNDLIIDKKRQEEILDRLRNIDNTKQVVEDINNGIFKYEVLKGKSININELHREQSSLIKTSRILEQIDDIQEIETETSKLTSRLKILAKLYSEYVNSINEKNGLEKKLNMLKSIDKTVKDVNILGEHLNSYNILIGLSKNYGEAINGIAIGKEFMGKLEGFLAYEDKINQARILTERHKVIKAIKGRYDDNIQQINSSIAELRNNGERYRLLLEKYGELLIDIGKCPYCMSDISEETVEQLIKNHLGGQ